MPNGNAQDDKRQTFDQTRPYTYFERIEQKRPCLRTQGSFTLNTWIEMIKDISFLYPKHSFYPLLATLSQIGRIFKNTPVKNHSTLGQIKKLVVDHFWSKKIKKDFIAFSCINLFVVISGGSLQNLETSQNEEEHSFPLPKHSYPLLSQIKP